MKKRDGKLYPMEHATPYWRRAHKDWRFRAAVLLMLAAISIYVLSGNLSWRSHLQTGNLRQ